MLESQYILSVSFYYFSFHFQTIYFPYFIYHNILFFLFYFLLIYFYIIFLLFFKNHVKLQTKRVNIKIGVKILMSQIRKNQDKKLPRQTLMAHFNKRPVGFRSTQILRIPFHILKNDSLHTFSLSTRSSSRLADRIKIQLLGYRLYVSDSTRSPICKTYSDQ